MPRQIVLNMRREAIFRFLTNFSEILQTPLYIKNWCCKYARVSSGILLNDFNCTWRHWRSKTRDKAQKPDFRVKILIFLKMLVTPSEMSLSGLEVF